MFLSRSPPLNNGKKKLGGSFMTASNKGVGKVGSDSEGAVSSSSSSSSVPLLTATSSPTSSLFSASSFGGVGGSFIGSSSQHHHHHHQHYNNQQQHQSQYHNLHPHSYSRNNNSSGSASGNMKRNKRNAWGNRERAGMSFLIVIAFFAVFGLIILTELFMIDDKNHGGIVVLRHGNLGGRMGDSMPDYDNVKDDYDLADGGLLVGDTKLGIFQFRTDNKLKIHDRLSGGLSVAHDSLPGEIGGGNTGGGGSSINNRLPLIPWGQILPTKIEQTLPHYPVGLEPTDGSWQIVNGTRFKFFVFSAYYDRRDGGKFVRVIGATKTRSPEKVWCRLWYPYKDGSNRTKHFSATVMARVKVIRENWNLKYSACFVLCPLRAPGLDVPHSVSIISRLRAPPGNILRLRNTDQDLDFANRSVNQIPDKIAVCVKPFHFNYDQGLHLLEFLELNTLLGISHFTFYNHTLGPHATCILQHYIDGRIPTNLTSVDYFDFEVQQRQEQKRNEAVDSVTIKKIHKKLETSYSRPTVNILPWNLRMRSQKEIRTEGLFAALNDCLYRNMYRYSHLALIDLDEFIIPRHNDTLSDLLRYLTRRFSNRNTGAYSFQNAFFYLQFPDDSVVYEMASSSNPSLRGALVTQRKTRRRSKLHPQKQRSKYICKPEAVVEAGNHFVWEFVPGKGSLNVPADAGILHHYRVCEFGGDDCIKSPSIVDRMALKYHKRLMDRVQSVYNHLKGQCNLPNLPPPPTRPPPTVRKIVKTNAQAHNLTAPESSSSNNHLQKSKASQMLSAKNAVNHKKTPP